MNKQGVFAFGFMFLALALTACDDSRLNDITRYPATLTITVSPPRTDFNVGETVVLGFVALDQDGIILDGVEPEWQVPDSVQVHALGGGQFQFMDVGSFTWTCSLPEFQLSDTVTLNAAAVPATIEITVDPQQDYYGIGEQVALGVVVRDGDGVELSGFAVNWQVPPAADVLDLGQDSYEFLREGGHTWTATLEAPWGISDSVTLVVDGAGPVLTVEVPERGDTILMDNPEAQVTVMGSVEDSSAGLASLTVRTGLAQAVLAQVEANGTYSALITAEPGLNVVVVEALDEAGNSTQMTRAFYYSPDFFSFADDTLGRERLSAMEDVLITDRALDRGSPLDQPPFDPCSFDGNDLYDCPAYEDIASLLEVALNSLDYTSMQDQLDFNFPILNQYWEQDLAGFASVSFRLTGDFDLNFAFQDVGVGEAKITDLSAFDAGIRNNVSFEPYTDSQGQYHAGLYAHLGMTGTLSFLATIDLVATDPFVQAGLCLAAELICANGICLDEYLGACTSNPLPIASIISTIAPQDGLLAGLDIDNMSLEADLLVSLDGANQAQVDLARMDLAIGQGVVDVSALSGLVIDLGTAQFAGYGVDLGTFEIPLDFIADLASDLLTPLVDALLPMMEPALEMVFSCTDPDNPVCFIIPFFEQMMNSFTTDTDLVLAHPFGGSDPLTTLHLTTGFEELIFRTGFGGNLILDGRLDGVADPAVANHMDDDLLGIGLLGGCLDADPGFGGLPTGGKALQVAPALDLINQGLFALWYSGGLELQLDENAFVFEAGQSVTALSLTVAAWLPVVLNHCPAATWEVVAQLGDTGLTMSFDRGGHQYQVSGFASQAVHGLLEMGSDEDLHLALGETDQFEFEFSQLTVDGLAAFPDGPEAQFVRGLVRDTLLPQLMTSTSDALLAELDAINPVFDISVFPGVTAAVMQVVDVDVQTTDARAVQNGELGN